jgi:hypothetical protein
MLLPESKWLEIVRPEKSKLQIYDNANQQRASHEKTFSSTPEVEFGDVDFVAKSGK